MTDTAWTMPDLDTVFHIEEGGTMTLREMLEGLDEDLVPASLGDFENMLWAYGAWSDLAEMDAAMRARTYDRDLGDEIGFRAME